MANVITAGNSSNGGTAITTDTSGTLNIVTGSGSGATAISVDTSQSTTFNSAASTAPFIAKINGTESARIDSSGNLCLGTDTAVGLFTARNNSASQATAFFSNTAASSQAIPSAYFRKFDNTSTTSQVFLQFQINNGAAGSGQINANGASAAAFGAFSDRRLKENITELPSQLSNIMALRPVEFDYIESEGGGHQIGFIAQEVNEIYPDLVGEREDGMFTLTDMNKNDARLIKAIQEQQAMILELKAELDAVKAKVGV